MPAGPHLVTTMPLSPPLQWARLTADYDCPLRRGAWYRVVSVSQLEVVVEVHGKQVLVARPYVELVNVPPPRWTVVARTKQSRRVPGKLGTQYVVCPSCRERVPLAGTPTKLRCRRCAGVFQIAWEG